MLSLQTIMTERIEKLNTMLKLMPNDCFLWHALALEYAKTGDYSSAQAYFEKVLSIDANYIGSYYHLGKTVEKLNNLDAAKLIYEEGIRRAGVLNDRHARSELQQALDDISDE
ncbi:MAG: tetratricopeptide repeat protein [Chitinophagaceae bacterium]